MKRRGAKGLGGGWDKMRGVKRIQFICNKTGTKRMRREDAARIAVTGGDEEIICGTCLARLPNDLS